jgi:hypothetical protein
MGKKHKTTAKNNARRISEQQTPRNTWEATQGKVTPTIVEIGKDGLGKAKHPHWRNDAAHRGRLDQAAKIANRHQQVKP